MVNPTENTYLQGVHTVQRAKEALLGTVFVLGGFLLGWVWSEVTTSDLNNLGSSKIQLWYLLFVVLYVILFSVFSLLVRTKWLALLAFFLSALAMHVRFPFSPILGTSVLGGTLLMFWGYVSIGEEYEASARIYLRRVIGRNLGMFFTALCLMLALLTVNSIGPEQSSAKVLLPKSIFVKIFTALEGPMQAFLPGLTAGDTVDDYLAKTIRKQIGSADISASAL
ncbi:MAG: hypothetical protein HYW88_00175, partial [Candidatus Sungbacteria bacterium]|nr:hypothetical protein [Candidatus Sungbacteria bacterium]